MARKKASSVTFDIGDPMVVLEPIIGQRVVNVEVTEEAVLNRLADTTSDDARIVILAKLPADREARKAARFRAHVFNPSSSPCNLNNEGGISFSFGEYAYGEKGARLPDWRADDGSDDSQRTVSFVASHFYVFALKGFEGVKESPKKFFDRAVKAMELPEAIAQRAWAAIKSVKGEAPDEPVFDVALSTRKFPSRMAAGAGLFAALFAGEHSFRPSLDATAQGLNSSSALVLSSQDVATASLRPRIAESTAAISASPSKELQKTR